MLVLLEWVVWITNQGVRSRKTSDSQNTDPRCAHALRGFFIAVQPYIL